MNLLGAWKKVLLFGALGAAGCLAGWLVGEPYLFAVAKLTDADKKGQQPSLISSPVSPAADAPPLPNDIRERLERERGKTGDVQLTLIWYNVNDLDLHCKDPNGEVIFYKNRRGRSGGELDVDANAGPRAEGGRAELTREPVENIYWPTGGAPPGRYQVLINHYSHRPEAGAPNDTQYKVNVLHDGKRQEFEGTVRNNGTPRNERMIYEFELKAKLTPVAPEAFDLPPGAALKVPVAVRRAYYKGPVEVKVENLPEGVTAGKLTIPEGKDEGELELTATEGAKEVKRGIKFVASGGGLESSADSQLNVPRPTAEFSAAAVVSIGVWTALLAVGLCLALLAGQNKYLGKSLFATSGGKLALVIVGAAVAGFVSGSLGQALFFGLFSLGVGKLGFLVGWVLLGALLGRGVSLFIPNLDGTKATVAGVAGGLLGAVAFLIASLAADWVGRLGGAALLGFCIGLMVAVVEAAFRSAWLEIRYSDREVITVNLGPEPVKIGGDAKACTVWARGAADVALRYFVRDGKVVCEDVPARREATAGDGDTRTAGSLTVVVRTSAAGPVKGPPPLPARPAPPLPPPVSAPHGPQARGAGPVTGGGAAAIPPRPVPPPPPAPAPIAPPPSATKPPVSDYDDGLPMPLSPPAPARPAATSILDADGGWSASAPPAAKPAAPPKPPGPAAKPPVPPAAPKPPVPAGGAKPPAPAPPKPPTPAAPRPPVSSAPAPGADACPTCKRKIPGAPGTRYCMVCDKTF